MTKYYYIVAANNSKPKIEKIGKHGTKLLFSEAHCQCYEAGLADSEQTEANFKIVEEKTFQKGKPSFLFRVLLTLGLISTLILLFSSIIGGDILKLSGNWYALSSDIVAIAGLLFAIISFPKVKQILNNFLSYGWFENRLYLIMMILLFSILVSAILFFSGLNIPYGNFVGLIALLISIKVL